MKTRHPSPLAFHAALIPLLLSACGGSDLQSCDSDCDSGLDAPVRLIWFGADYDGDPAEAPNPHTVYQSTASDGVHFTDSVGIFEGEDLVDPDFFPVPEASGGGYGLIWSKFSDGNLYYAHSATVDGTYESVGGAITTGGQSATLLIDDVLTTFITGVQSFPVSIEAASGASIAEGQSAATVVSAATLGLSSGIVGDPTVIRVADGSYRAFVKYAEAGAQPRSHQLWTLTSSDAVNWTGATKLRDGASVPGAVFAGDTILVYFVDFSGDYSSTGSLAVGYSTDNGATFDYSAVFLDGTEITDAYDPAALALD